MKAVKPFVVAVIAAVLLSGCLYAHILQPLDTDVDRTTLGQKIGRASSYSILGLVAWGDASTAAAAKNGGIATVNHLDREVTNIFFGLYVERVTIAYGD